jgi:hypothetical protein
VSIAGASLGDGVLRDDAWFAALRAREFGRLDRSGEAYLDYTGSALYAESQVRGHLELLAGSVLGNPHSQSVASLRSSEIIEDARRLTLAFFSADPGEYEVVFTANASGAIRLVAEAFRFQAGSRLVLAADNHNSVNGIRELARARGADVVYARWMMNCGCRVWIDRLRAQMLRVCSLSRRNPISRECSIHWVSSTRRRGLDMPCCSTRPPLFRRTRCAWTACGRSSWRCRSTRCSGTRPA